jgi:TATA-box binding protein (TBP) (component of TFIID and TFIIIB)
MKLFRNGSLQMTGVKSAEDFTSVMRKLFEAFRRVKAVIKNGTFRPKPFVADAQKMRVYNIKVNLINTNCHTNFEIDRLALHKLLLADNIRSTYQPCMHSAVNTKYYHQHGSARSSSSSINEKDVEKVTIFAFESGALIITCGGCIDYIYEARRFIFEKLNEYGHRIVLIKTDRILQESKRLNSFLDTLPDPLQQLRLDVP